MMAESILRTEIIKEIEDFPEESLPKVLKLIHFFKDVLLNEKVNNKRRGSLAGLWGNIEIEDEILDEARKSLFKHENLEGI